MIDCLIDDQTQEKNVGLQCALVMDFDLKWHLIAVHRYQGQLLETHLL